MQQGTSTLQEEWQSTLEPDADRLTELMLNRLAFIEIGRIYRVEDDKIHALVDILSTQKKRIRCEIISIGCQDNSIQVFEESQPVLVVYPCNAVELSTMSINIGNKPFNAKYAKCIPIGLGGKGTVKLGAYADSVHVTSDKYDTTFSTHGVAITADGFNINADCINKRASIRANKTLVTIKDGGVDIVVDGEWQYGTLVQDSGVQFSIKEGKVKIVGDLEVTGNFSAAEGNFEATV